MLEGRDNIGQSLRACASEVWPCQAQDQEKAHVLENLAYRLWDPEHGGPLHKQNKSLSVLLDLNKHGVMCKTPLLPLYSKPPLPRQPLSPFQHFLNLPHWTICIHCNKYSLIELDSEETLEWEKRGLILYSLEFKQGREPRKWEILGELSSLGSVGEKGWNWRAVSWVKNQLVGVSGRESPLLYGAFNWITISCQREYFYFPIIMGYLCFSSKFPRMEGKVQSQTHQNYKVREEKTCR